MGKRDKRQSQVGWGVGRVGHDDLGKGRLERINRVVAEIVGVGTQERGLAADEGQEEEEEEEKEDHGEGFHDLLENNNLGEFCKERRKE